jgi:hypothetical protein
VSTALAFPPLKIDFDLRRFRLLAGTIGFASSNGLQPTRAFFQPFTPTLAVSKWVRFARNVVDAPDVEQAARQVCLRSI